MRQQYRALHNAVHALQRTNLLRRNIPPPMLLQIARLAEFRKSPKLLGAPLYTNRVDTRGNKYKLRNKSIPYDIQKYSVKARTINTWNSLPYKIIDAESVNIFKTRLDKYWSNQPLLYDFKAKLAGTGDRSKCDIEV